MRVALISDIHNEFIHQGNGDLSEVPDLHLANQKVDVIVLAGDIDIKTYGVDWAIRQSEIFNLPVIYVAGNHEFYKGRFVENNDEMKALASGTDVHILDNESIIIDGVRFIGGTLWTDYALFGQDRAEELMTYAEYRMNDYQAIKLSLSGYGNRKVRPQDLKRWHDYTVNFIENKLAEKYEGKTVVVTHHAPLMQSVAETEREDLLSANYASDLSELIEQHQPDYWLHGHIHHKNVYRHGETVVISHPRGYPHIQDKPRLGYKPMVVVIEQ